MKILFLIRSLDPAGAERQLTLLANGLASRGHEVSIAVFYPNGTLETELQNVHLINLRKTGRWDMFGFMARLLSTVRVIRPDIVHSYLGTANLLTGLLRSFFHGAKVVWGVRASSMQSDTYGVLHNMHLYMERLFAKRADLIIFNSEAGKKHALAQGYPKKECPVIPNGIDTNTFCPNQESRQKLRQEWGLQDKEQLIGLPARLDPMKDHPTFFRAAKKLLASHPNTRFILIGDGPAAYTRQLKEQASNLGITTRLIWAGCRTDMPAVYNALDVSCSSSAFGEGFSNTLAEAMACGIPCVATDVGDAARIVIDPNLVVPPGDATSLASALTAALTTNAISRSAYRNHIIQQYGCTKMIEHTQILLGNLVAQ